MKKKSLSQTLIDAAKDFGFDKATVASLEELDTPEVRTLHPQRDTVEGKSKSGCFCGIA